MFKTNKLHVLAAVITLIGSLVVVTYGQKAYTYTYTAKLSNQDHFNSSGARIKSAADIIRQDRANFHKFNKRDKEDTNGNVFSTASARAEIPKKLVISKSTAKKIVDGTPTVIVTVTYLTMNDELFEINVGIK